MANLKSIGNNIAKIRKKKSLSQEDLAGLCDMDRSYLSEIENGHKNMSVNILIKIAKALNIKVGSLVDD
jgi:transcriptional regulator with XRE-family HTH domain